MRFPEVAAQKAPFFEPANLLIVKPSRSQASESHCFQLALFVPNLSCREVAVISFAHISITLKTYFY